MNENTVDSENKPDAAPKRPRKQAKKAKAAKKAHQPKKAASKPKAERANKKAEVIAMMKRAKGATLANSRHTIKLPIARASSRDVAGSGTGASPGDTVAEYGAVWSMPESMNTPPFNGSPSYQSPLRMKVPLLTKPSGAVTSQVNS
jgi:hypothetical protein